MLIQNLGVNNTILNMESTFFRMLHFVWNLIIGFDKCRTRWMEWHFTEGYGNGQQLEQHSWEICWGLWLNKSEIVSRQTMMHIKDTESRFLVSATCIVI